MIEEQIKNKALVQAENYDTKKEKFAFVCGALFGATETTKELKQYINFLEGKVSELMSEINGLRNTFLCPEKKPFDVPQHPIELKLDEIPTPFI